MGNLLDKKVCLITGASKGIGKGVVEKFAQEGAIVYANARESGAIDKWALSINENSKGKIYPIYFDVTDFDSVSKAILHIKNESQRVDILVNNAGVVTYELLGMINFQKVREMIDVNILGSLNLIQVVSRLMTRQKSGSIINISSIVASKGAKGQVAYSATKGAIIAMTKSASKELAPYNIRVNALAPGMVSTERFLQVFEKSLKDKLNNVGMGRLATVEEIANACLFLGSDLSEYITGQILEVDGSTII